MKYRKITEIMALMWFLLVVIAFGGLCLYLWNNSQMDWIAPVVLLTVVPLGCLLFIIAFFRSIKARHSWLLALLFFSVPACMVFAKVLMENSPYGESIRREYTAVETPVQKTSPPIPVEPTVQSAPVEPKHGYQEAPIVNIERKSIWVRGTTRKELCQEIERYGLKEDGETVRVGYMVPSLLYNLIPIYTSRGWTVGNFTVTANSTIRVPQWESSKGATDGTKVDWSAFKDSVKDHENTHQEILEKHAQRLVDALNAFGYYPTQEALDSAIEDKYRSIYEQMDNDHDRFDKKDKEEGGLEYYKLCGF